MIPRQSRANFLSVSRRLRRLAPSHAFGVGASMAGSLGGPLIDTVVFRCRFVGRWVHGGQYLVSVREKVTVPFGGREDVKMDDDPLSCSRRVNSLQSEGG